MRVRLIWRNGTPDAEGQFVGWEYRTDIVELPDDSEPAKYAAKHYGQLPEIIGCEQIKEAPDA